MDDELDELIGATLSKEQRTGRLTPAEREALVLWINATWKRKECPLCGVNNWDPNRYTLVPLGDPDYGDVWRPLGLVGCLNCGYTVFVNLRTAGVWGKGRRR